MRVHLINPPPPPAGRVSRGLMGGFGMVVGEGLCYPPLDLMYVAAILKRDGHEVLVTDAEAQVSSQQEVLDAIAAFGPDLIGFSTSSATIEQDLSLVTEVKLALPDVPVFITGSQGSKIPDMAMAGSTVDAVVRGEPELTVAAMAQAMASGGDPLAVDGLSVRRGDQISHNPDRPLLKGDALDALPFPERGLLPLDWYRIPTMEGPLQAVQSSRGCPINCTYCGYVVAQGIPWRGRSAVNVFDELREIVEVHGVTNVVFRDPLFAYDRDRVESGNEELQKKYSRGKIKTHDHAKIVVDSCKKHGIGTRGFFMIGFPEETPEMAEETMNLAVLLDPDTVQFTAVTPYPDTKLYKESMASRGESGDFDFSKFTGTTPVGVAQAMTGEQVSRLIRKAYRRFYMRPSRVLGELRRPQLLLQRLRRYVGLVQQSS